VVFAPGDLIDADVDQPAQPVRIEHVRGHPLADRADRAPRDADEAGDRGLVGLGHQPRHQVLDVAGVAGPVSGEWHALHQQPVLGAPKPPAPQHDPADPATHVQLASAQPHRHPQLAVDEDGLTDPHTGQLEDSVG
jgi:hypothetical protein